MTCAYKRIECLPEWLERMVLQDFPGKFEIILWNNNFQARNDVQDIVERYSSRLTMRVMHSSENLYCGIRFAAPNLMRSDVLVVCDDDVLPEPNYLSKLWRKHKQYGVDAVVCARGHTFLPHELDAQQPEQMWRTQEYIEFHDESEPDQPVHFFHADNCIISRALLKRAVSVDMEVPEFVLVDDYWLSYVISHLLGGQLQKIKADDVLKYHPRADDARVAMFQDTLVREQRVNFYIYHMQRGWPFAARSDLSSK
jgi:GT2 family glycosyltransferase